jgi:hypothetical protein
VVVAVKDKLEKNKKNNLFAIKKIEKAFEHKIFKKNTQRAKDTSSSKT